MARLILMRHGESKWNKLNLFTGWVDVPLSPVGVDEALRGGELIKDEPIDIIYTSSLMRAQMTAMLAMNVHHSGKVPVIQHPAGSKQQEWAHNYSPDNALLTIPVICAWELNERMYGKLQGLNKEETMRKYGTEQVHIWRRSYDVPPPDGESLEMTAARSIPYFEAQILPRLKKGENVFICAHGNSLRSIMMDLDKLTPAEVLKLELPTGVPVIYNFQTGQYQKVSK